MIASSVADWQLELAWKSKVEEDRAVQLRLSFTFRKYLKSLNRMLRADTETE